MVQQGPEAGLSPAEEWAGVFRASRWIKHYSTTYLLWHKCLYSETGCGSAGAARRRRGGRSRRNTELAALVRGALEQTILVELLPRAQVDVCMQVLFADGGVTAACINAAMLAVADAGAGFQAARHFDILLHH